MSPKKLCIPSPKSTQEFWLIMTHVRHVMSELQSAKTLQEKESVQRQVESTDGAIDKLVYELYGLTEEEIGIVEGK